MQTLTGISKQAPRLATFKPHKQPPCRLILLLVKLKSRLNVSVCVSYVCLSVHPAGQRKQMLREGAGVYSRPKDQTSITAGNRIIAQRSTLRKRKPVRVRS